jgi:hypothetical protein
VIKDKKKIGMESWKFKKKRKIYFY